MAFVNVSDWVGRKFSAVPVKTYRVPDAPTGVTTGPVNPAAGMSVPVTTTAAATESVTTRSVIVAPPVFVSTIWYVTGRPMPWPFGVIWVLRTANVRAIQR